LRSTADIEQEQLRKEAALRQKQEKAKERKERSYSDNEEDNNIELGETRWK
jgi:hypothetical protein